MSETVTLTLTAEDCVAHYTVGMQGAYLVDTYSVTATWNNLDVPIDSETDHVDMLTTAIVADTGSVEVDVTVTDWTAKTVSGIATITTRLD